MKNNLRIAILFTLVTTVLFGLIYPLGVTGLAQLLFPAQANGSLIRKNGKVIGSQPPRPILLRARPISIHAHRMQALVTTHRNPRAQTSGPRIIN